MFVPVTNKDTCMSAKNLDLIERFKQFIEISFQFCDVAKLLTFSKITEVTSLLFHSESESKCSENI